MTCLPEKRHIKTSTNLTGLECLASFHPFTQQVDVIFPSESIGLEDVLSRLSAKYAKGRVDLADVFVAGCTFVRPYTEAGSSERVKVGEGSKIPDSASASLTRSSILALSVNSDDLWCIDTRGVLTLCVCKETYEKIGLVGQKLPFRHQGGERYVISLPLHENAESPATQARHRNALQSWDTSLNGPNPNGGPSSSGAWDIVYCSATTITKSGEDGLPNDGLDQWTAQVPVAATTVKPVTCEKGYFQDIWVPNPSTIPPRPDNNQKDELDDWDHDIMSLFEWVGMAGLRAQRLKANDSVDPFVALYEPPASSRVGNITHLRWKGFSPPAFVQSIIDESVEYLKAMKPPHRKSEADSFVAITVHGITNSPIAYLPQSQSHHQSATVKSSNPPAHLPRVDGEDTWCLVLMSDHESTGRDVRSILVECVGQWDARWG